MKDKNFVIALLLTFSSGFCDVYSYILLGGVFTSMQTGNIVKLMLIDLNLINVLKYLAPILSFVIGVFITNALNKTKIGQYLCGLIIVAFIVIIFFLPDTDIFMIISNCLLSINCAIIFENEKSRCNLTYTPTMCTNNLRLMTVDLFNFISKKKDTKCLFYLIIISSFALGCLAGRLLIDIMNRYAIFIILTIYLLILIFSIIIKKFSSNNQQQTIAENK